MAGTKRRSTPEKQTLILWALLVCEHASSFQNELRPEPEKADRDALARDGFVKWEKRGQRIWIEATDKAWEWAGRNLGAALPKNSPAAGRVLQGWLTRLKAFMELRGLALADILSPQDIKKPEIGSVSTGNYQEVRSRIRKAYLDVTGGRLNACAFLNDIRERLSDTDRETVDQALVRMHLEDGTTLSGLNNPRDVTPAIRDAAVRFKGEPMYVLWITK